MSETGTNSIDAVYAAIRRISGVVAPPPPAGAAAAGVRVFPLRTPTLPPAAHTGCYVVGPAEGAGELLVIDPASPYPEEQASLDAILDAEAAAGRRVLAIALTHHHGDHIGGAAHLASRLGVPVLAHADTAQRVAAICPVHRLLDDGEEIDVGGVQIGVLHTPGHAPGHLCFRTPGGDLVVGDMVAGIGTILIDPGEGDMSAYLSGLERLLALAPGRLLPAHGPVIVDGPAKLREYLAHRRMREAKVAAALAELGAARSSELVERAYADTPAPMWPFAERSLIAHLVKLERDGRARRAVDGRWHAV